MDAKFVYWYLLSSRQRLLAEGKGGAQQNISQTVLKAFEIGLPPLAEQRRIVARLDAIEAHRRAAKERLDVLPERLDQYRQSVLAAAFRGDLTAGWRAQHPDAEPSEALLDRIRAERRRGYVEDKVQKAIARAEARDAEPWAADKRSKRLAKERVKAEAAYKEPAALDASDLPPLPDGWAWCSVDDLLPPDGIFDGPFGSRLKTADYTNAGVRVVRLENVGHLEFVGEKETFVSEKTYAGLDRHTVGEGDIIFASFVDKEVRVCILPDIGTAIAKADCFCLRPMDAVVSSSFLTYQLATDRAHQELKGEIHGSTRPRINTSQLRALPVCIAPVAEQNEIVRLVSTALDKVRGVKESTAIKLAALNSLRQATLARAFRGELVPTEAELERLGATEALAESGPAVSAQVSLEF